MTEAWWEIASGAALRARAISASRSIRYCSIGAIVGYGCLGSCAIAPRPAAAQDPKQPYPTMAPIEQYLMDRDAEIALARSAAPDAISHHASVIALTPHGYDTPAQGKN